MHFFIYGIYDFILEKVDLPLDFIFFDKSEAFFIIILW